MNAIRYMSFKEFYLKDLSACRALAKRLASTLQPGDIITFNGNLGAGKTEFCRSIIHSMGYDEDVPSPTFSLVQVYEPELDNIDMPTVWHLDLYRLESESDVFELGVEEAFDNAVTLIEWPEKMGENLPSGHLQIDLQMGDTENARIVKFSGNRYWQQKLGAFEA